MRAEHRSTTGCAECPQAELKEGTAPLLQKAVPGLTDDLVAQMKVSPLRQFDPQLIQDPLVYRLYEVIRPALEASQILCNSSRPRLQLICMLT